MSFNIDDVKKIAHLARLAIDDQQAAQLQQELDKILSMVSRMDREDTQSARPMANPLDEYQPMRTDQVTEINQRETLMANAPQSEAGFFVVPQFVESE